VNNIEHFVPISNTLHVGDIEEQLIDFLKNYLPSAQQSAVLNNNYLFHASVPTLAPSGYEGQYFYFLVTTPTVLLLASSCTSTKSAPSSYWLRARAHTALLLACFCRCLDPAPSSYRL
jgi:hypothetical protein